MSKGRSPLQGKAKEYARILREHLPELRERYGVESLGLFGSYVRGEENEGSDLDVLVEFSRSIAELGTRIAVDISPPPDPDGEIGRRRARSRDSR